MADPTPKAVHGGRLTNREVATVLQRLTDREAKLAASEAGHLEHQALHEQLLDTNERLGGELRACEAKLAEAVEIERGVRSALEHAREERHENLLKCEAAESQLRDAALVVEKVRALRDELRLNMHDKGQYTAEHRTAFAYCENAIARALLSPVPSERTP